MGRVCQTCRDHKDDIRGIRATPLASSSSLGPHHTSFLMEHISRSVEDECVDRGKLKHLTVILEVIIVEERVNAGVCL